MQYEYDLSQGSTRTLLQKISSQLSIPIEDIYISTNSNTLFVGFNNIVLTIEQKNILDSIMLNPYTLPNNTGNTTYKFADMYGARKWLADKFGVPSTWYFDEPSSDGSTPCYIYIHFSRSLTVGEKSYIKSILFDVQEV